MTRRHETLIQAVYNLDWAHLDPAIASCHNLRVYIPISITSYAASDVDLSKNFGKFAADPVMQYSAHFVLDAKAYKHSEALQYKGGKLSWTGAHPAVRNPTTVTRRGRADLVIS